MGRASCGCFFFLANHDRIRRTRRVTLILRYSVATLLSCEGRYAPTLSEGSLLRVSEIPGNFYFQQSLDILCKNAIIRLRKFL